TMTGVKAPPVRSNDQCLPRIRWVQTGYLKFSAKGTKREVFGMPILGSLITADLQEGSYYQEYLANVVKHRWGVIEMLETELRENACTSNLTSMGKGAGFLWERVWEVMGSSWSSGGVVRSGEEVVAGLAGERGCVQCMFKRGEEDWV
nr:hypothetical protein [Tanacetum cinerariifolium]